MMRSSTPAPGPAPGPAHTPATARRLTQDLLNWYDRNARTLPWRVSGEARADPYHVWLSEIMLQQTTVVTVTPYYIRFLERWPTVQDLAAAPIEAVLGAWAGLGYYARARNLHKCARMISEHYGARFPEGEAELRKLPGIGRYTAAAIAAIAFDLEATPVDGNFERVTARLHAVTQPLPTAKAELRRLAEAQTPAKRPGDYAQAMMDLGATICTPRRPKCPLCPWQQDCAAHAAGIAEELPRKIVKKPKPTRHGAAFWCLNGEGKVLLRRRPPHGLLGGMMEIPSDGWNEAGAGGGSGQEGEPGAPPFAAEWQPLPGLVRHTFTHFHLEMIVATARIKEESAPDWGEWRAIPDLSAAGLPSLMVKVARHAIRHMGQHSG